MKVICIAGHAQYGKDTLAGFLKTELEACGKKAVIIHYADQLKYICREYFGWNGQDDSVGRTLLQRIGTGYARAKDPDIWVKYVSMFLQVFGSIYDFAIIPDCRFPNEIEWAYGIFDVITIRVDRPGFDNGLTNDQKNHPSETALDNYDFDITVHNAGTLEDLRNQADTMVKIMKWYEPKESSEVM